MVWLRLAEASGGDCRDFYARAWREKRRVAASSIAHASVDAIWSLWF
jgi:hypothetical protein